MGKKVRGFEFVREYCQDPFNLKRKAFIPKRATIHSAGYDFCSPQDIIIHPCLSEISKQIGGVVLVPTYIKVYMPEDEVLLLYIRSSLSMKYSIMLVSGVGVIDSDYYNNKENEGHIRIPLINLSSDSYEIKMGDKIAQGIFQKYYRIDGDLTKDLRSGGVGSTGKKIFNTCEVDSKGRKLLGKW